MHTIYFLEQMHALKLDQMHTMLLEQMNDLCLEQMLGSLHHPYRFRVLSVAQNVCQFFWGRRKYILEYILKLN